ncbi:MAG TPA: molybdopterin cofactor-binding domain-containing protein [Anaerolineales bacterium]|nr:molybdopterin cofactor-binding domain-containing protein [Anaerolineales bacterium]
MKEQLNRRDFIKLVGAAGGGLVLAVYLEGCASDIPETATVAPASSTSTVPPTTSTSTPTPPFGWAPSIYLKLDPTGTLTVTAFRSEMGQGIRTAIAMLIAEELDVDWSSVCIEQAPADIKFGDQLTGGSASISGCYSALRKAGAVARSMLLEAAAQIWDVDPAQCESEAGFVIHPDGVQKIAYGDLAEIAATLDVPDQASIKDESQFKIVGTAMGHWDAPQIVSGKAVYGLDVRLPGMLFAALARCPVFEGTFSDYKDAGAKAIHGVREVIALKDRIAVVAENSWAAIQGRNALQITWEEGRNATLDSEKMVAAAIGYLEKSTKSNILDAYYEIPYEAHATMEPMNCTAHFHDDICEVWAPTQNPQEVQRAVARASGLEQKQVVVHVPLIGGGFGRRLQTDYAAEAALVAKALNAPVQVLWTRDDDLQHDFYHAMAVQYASVALDKPSMPIIRVAGGVSVPTGAWRSVDQFTRAYAEQSFLDELAVALQRDPIDLRREIYKSSERALGVINLAAEKSDWGQPLAARQGRGIAYFATFGVTHVAQVAEVTVDTSGNVRVNRVVCAVDCGKVINPDNVAAQMESGIAFGLTAALKAEAVIKNGRARLRNFNDYPILRMDEMPKVEVHIVASGAHPSGIGEMGVPPIAPAVANAVYAATGKRIRHIPIRPEDLA